MKRSLLLALIALFLLVACRPEEVPPAPAAPPTAQPATRPPEAPTEAPAPTLAPTEEAAPDAPLAAARPAPLFDVAWDDRAPYAAGLVDPAADNVPGAPVYHIDATIDDSLTVVTGRETVYYTNQEDTPLDEVYFHLYPNLLDSRIEVSDVTVDGAAAETEISGANRSILRVGLPEPLAPGATTAISLDFRTDVATEIGRNYGVLAAYEGILALAHFFPQLSVYDATGWNTAEADIQGDPTYSDAAYYMVRVTAPDNVTLVGSGIGIDTAEADGTQSVTFVAGPARDFYLAAGDFIAVRERVGETTITSYAPSDLEPGARQALDVAGEALRSFSERLGPYPYTELDIVTTPTPALGIEYPGVIVGTLRMYDVEASTQAGVPYSAILESTTAHEVGHQWFYNLIGNDQLDEPWLDEAVVSYATYRYYVDRYGQAAGDQYFENFNGRWARVEAEPIPIGLPVTAYDETEYGAIVYGRGPVFVRELEETMGREAFDTFMRDYSAAFRWGTSTTAAFRAMAEEHCDCDLGSLFEAWVYR